MPINGSGGLTQPRFQGVQLSDNGVPMVFNTDAINLITTAPADTNNNDDVYLVDLGTNLVDRVSVAANGNQIPGLSQYPAMTGDGATLTWSTTSRGDPSSTSKPPSMTSAPTTPTSSPDLWSPKAGRSPLVRRPLGVRTRLSRV